MEGILNFIITKIRPLLYKIISSYCQTFFYGFLFKKKKISQTRIENFRSKKKKVLSLLGFIIGNRNE